MTHDGVSMVLFFGGLAGMLANLIRMFSGVTYETTRPWEGLHSRTRTRKDGSTYVQTYYSEGPAVSKAKMKAHWTFWLFLGAVWVGLFVG
jgi:hypothetical protein